VSEQNLIELLKVVSRNAASRYMAGTPPMTDDSQIIMDGAARIAQLERELAEAEGEITKAVRLWNNAVVRGEAATRRAGEAEKDLATLSVFIEANVEPDLMHQLSETLKAYRRGLDLWKNPATVRKEGT